MHALSWNVLFVCCIDPKSSRKRKPSTNFWFTGLTYSARTLHSHDLEESWWKSPTPSSTCCICLDIYCVYCVLYRSKIHTTVKELRWFLYSNRAAEGENLPPTSGSLDSYSARTLLSHDLEESWWKSPTPPSTCCIWLDIWRRFKSLFSCSMFESTSSWGSTAPDEVWTQKWMWRCSCRKNSHKMTEQ